MLWGYQSGFLVIPVKFKTGSPAMKIRKLKPLVKHNLFSCELLLVHITFYTNKDLISRELQHKDDFGTEVSSTVPLTPMHLTATKRTLSHRSHEIQDTNTLSHVLEVWLCSFCVTRKGNSLRADGDNHLQRASLQKKALGWDDEPLSSGPLSESVKGFSGVQSWLKHWHG